MIKSKIVYCFLAIIFLTIIGCSTTGPYKEFAGVVNQLQVGMSQNEVRNIIGEPDPTSIGYRGSDRLNRVFWSWDYRKQGFCQENHLTIYFSDKNGTVVDWREWSPALSL